MWQKYWTPSVLLATHSSIQNGRSGREQWRAEQLIKIEMILSLYNYTKYSLTSEQHKTVEFVTS